jgi:hypothetical protein
LQLRGIFDETGYLPVLSALFGVKCISRRTGRLFIKPFIEKELFIVLQ